MSTNHTFDNISTVCYASSLNTNTEGCWSFLFLLYFPIQKQAVTLNVTPEMISQSGSPTVLKIRKKLYSFKSGCFGTIHFHHHTSTISFFYREEGNPAGHRRLPPQSAGEASLLVVKGKKHQSQPLKSDGAVKSYHSLLSTTNPLYYPQDSMPTARAPAPGAIAAPQALR